MKKVTVISGLFVTMMSMPTLADSFNVCQQSPESLTCQSYLEGVVDGALMYRNDATANRIDPNNYASRALKFRAGKRYQQAYLNYCSSHVPVKSEIVSALAEQVSLNNVTNSDELESVINSLLDCRLTGK